MSTAQHVLAPRERGEERGPGATWDRRGATGHFADGKVRLPFFSPLLVATGPFFSPLAQGEDERPLT